MQQGRVEGRTQQNTREDSLKRACTCVNHTHQIHAVMSAHTQAAAPPVRMTHPCARARTRARVPAPVRACPHPCTRTRAVIGCAPERLQPMTHPPKHTHTHTHMRARFWSHRKSEHARPARPLRLCQRGAVVRQPASRWHLPEETLSRGAVAHQHLSVQREVDVRHGRAVAPAARKRLAAARGRVGLRGCGRKRGPWVCGKERVGAKVRGRAPRVCGRARGLEGLWASA
eukprot:1711882-Pleurochrysis_carterae.AAC.1